MTVPVIPTPTWTSQLYGTDPAFGNEIVTFQALVAGLPLPPLPSQPFLWGRRVARRQRNRHDNQQRCAAYGKPESHNVDPRLRAI